MRRHARAVLRPFAHLQGEWAAVARQPLHLQWRLRRQGVVVSRGGDDAAGVQGVVPRLRAPHPREPRDDGHESHVRLRGRGGVEARAENVRVFLPPLLLPTPRLHHQLQGVHLPRGSFPRGRNHSRGHQRGGPSVGASRPGYRLRHPVERPSGCQRKGGEQARHWVHVRAGRDEQVFGRQQPHPPRPLPRDERGRIRCAAWGQVHHHLFGAQLLRSDGQPRRVHSVRGRLPPPLFPVLGLTAPCRRTHGIRTHGYGRPHVRSHFIPQGL
mmetsp:Transcript_33930/g.80345  ORF Transcript_33930/g.80345 Transcript_33930/m.80345 type:complete len:269 (+) Transcript_33930:678-1484(+)